MTGGFATLFITYDLAVVREMAGRVPVMKYGRLVEVRDAAQVLKGPREKYTRSLLAAAP